MKVVVFRPQAVTPGEKLMLILHQAEPDITHALTLTITLIVPRPCVDRRFLEDNLKSKEYEIVRLRAALPSGGGGSSSTDTGVALSGGTTDGSAAGGGQVMLVMPQTHALSLTLPITLV